MLTDFGLSRMIQYSQAIMKTTARDATCGSMRWMAIELIKLQTDVDQSSEEGSSESEEGSAEAENGEDSVEAENEELIYQSQDEFTRSTGGVSRLAHFSCLISSHKRQ